MSRLLLPAETKHTPPRYGGWLLWILTLILVTLALIALRPRLIDAHIALAFLLVVLGGSSSHGRSLGILLASLAFLIFDWFFVPPYGTLTVAKPFDWIVLGAFLLTSLVAAEAFEKARREARIAGERERELDQLAQRADALSEAALLKDAVIASVSHDLRTPLTTIKALAAEIRADGDERAMTIEEEADRLNSMVADLLDMGRINSGTFSLKPEPNEAEDLLGAALERVQGTANGREIVVSLEPGEPLLIGRFDFTHTLRALVNLLENALKYSPPTKPVELKVRRENDWLVFSVLDRGEGIAGSDSDKIFEPFYRSPGSTPDVAGAGLGLSIGRALAIAQNGSLTYAPRDGGGSVFSLRLPAIDLEELNQV